MKTIGIWKQRASAANRSVRRRETLGVTDRGQVVAVLARPAQGPLPELATVFRSIGSVHDELRAEP